jgi:hypothetical protein
MDSNLLVSMLGLALMIAILLVIIWNEYRSWAAERRAERLVEHFLTSEELAHLRRRGYLDVKSQAIPGRFYRIPIDPGMVAVIEPDKPRRMLCLKPQQHIPFAEHVLMHKLLLEGAEAEYLKRANCFTAILGRPARR